jgi:hypothetical protein
MKILALRAQSGGFRGCFIHNGKYRFFLLSKNGRVRQRMAYSVDDYENHDHFLAVMLKYILPATIFRDPVEIKSLTHDELTRVINMQPTEESVQPNQ